MIHQGTRGRGRRTEAAVALDRLPWVAGFQGRIQRGSFRNADGNGAHLRGLESGYGKAQTVRAGGKQRKAIAPVTSRDHRESLIGGVVGENDSYARHGVVRAGDGPAQRPRGIGLGAQETGAGHQPDAGDQRMEDTVSAAGISCRSTALACELNTLA